jgi:hypothetical protein
MPRITDRHLDHYREHGYAVVEGFLTRDEVARAMEGFHQVFAPTDEDRRAGRKADYAQQVFPWDHSGLNQVALHPELIDAAARVIGTREIRLSCSDINVRYPGFATGDGSFHIDFGNNTKGPYPRVEDHGNMTFGMVLTDVREGMAPTLVVPWGKPDAEAIPMTLPAGSVYIYSTHRTRHSASSFTAASGLRATMWTIWCRKDRPWDWGRAFTYKDCGGHKDAALRRAIAEATPRQREMLDFPAVDDPLWTEDFLQGMVERYPGFDPEPYRAARRPRTRIAAA